jgi:hypothetical protein
MEKTNEVPAVVCVHGVLSVSEAFYDAEIGPKLLELAKLCEARGMSFVANVEYGDGETASTVSLAKSAGIKVLLSAWATRCHGNVDSLWNAIVKHAREYGHNSVYLHLAKVPTKPQTDGVQP